MPRFMSFAARVAVGGFVLLLPAAVLAQTSTAAINGTIQDATGAVIPEAEVVLTNVATGVERRTLSNNVGNYVILFIPPGDYVIDVTKDGFSTARDDEVSLAVNQTATYNFTMAVGATTETITVEAVGAEIESSTSELGTVIGDQEVVDLPLNGRNFTQLITLTPGVSPVSVAQNRGGFGTNPVGSFSFPSINGQINRSNVFTLDGINNIGSHVNTYAVAPIVDAIQEFKVQSHNDQAEFGGGVGGVINVVTKSGTNELHGTMWEFLRNDALDARNPFFRNVTRPFRQNQFGANRRRADREEQDVLLWLVPGVSQHEGFGKPAARADRRQPAGRPQRSGGGHFRPVHHAGGSRHARPVPARPVPEQRHSAERPQRRAWWPTPESSSRPPSRPEFRARTTSTIRPASTIRTNGLSRSITSSARTSRSCSGSIRPAIRSAPPQASRGFSGRRSLTPRTGA